MDPVRLRIEAEVTQALVAVNKLREDYLTFSAVAKKYNAEYARSVSEMSRVMNSLSGDAAIRAASQYVQAIQSIGGANRLTEHEQVKVNKALVEAAEKYRALGKEVPAELQKIINATAAAGKKIHDHIGQGFSGQKIAADATRVVTAIERIGGVSKLTERELKQVAKVLEEASAKSKQMGEVVPANIRKVLDEVRKLTNSKGQTNLFGGDKLTREANAYVEAIKKIGGVSRLTASEQEKVNKVLTQAAEKYRALGKAVPAEMQAILNATRRVTQETERAGSGWGKFALQVTGAMIAGQTAVTFASVLIRRALQNIVDGIENVGKGFVYLVERGSEVERIQGAFQRLAGTVKDQGGVFQDWKTTLSAGREGIAGLASDMDLMQAANKAILLGLPLTADNFKTLTGAAVQLGRAMGISASKGIDDLIVALGRSSPRILDNLGIIVKIRDATRTWADAHHMQVTAMSAEQRTLAFYEEAMRKIQQRLEQLGPIVLTLDEKFKLVSVAVQNFRDRLSLAVALSPVLNKAMDVIGQAIIKNLGGNQEAMIRRMVQVINDFAINTVKVASIVVKAIGYISAALAGWAKQAEDTNESVIKAMRDSLEMTRLVLKGLAALPGSDAIGIGKAEESVKAVVHGLNLMMNVGQKTKEVIGNTAEAIRKGADATSAFLDKLIPQLEAVRNQYVSEIDIHNAIIRSLNEEGTAQERLTKTQIKEIEKRSKAYLKAANDLKRLETPKPGGILQILNNPFTQLPLKTQMGREELGAFGGITEKQYKANAKLVKQTISKELNREPIDVIINAGKIGNLKDWMDYEARVGHFSKVTETWDKSLKKATASFAQLAQIMGASDTKFSRLMATIGQLVGLMNIGTQAGKQFRVGWDQMNASVDKGKVNWKQMGGAMADMALQVPQMIAAMDAATQGATKMNRVISGAATGASIGGAIVPGYGHLVGAIVGAIVGAVRKVRFREEIANVAKKWGLEINEELAKAIEKDAKTRFKGDWIAARLFHLGDIIEQGGGITKGNLTNLTQGLNDIFSAVETGKMSVDDARTSFDKAFPMFVDFIEKEGMVATDAIHRLITLNKEFGMESKAILEFINKNLDTFGGAMKNIISPLKKDVDGILAEMERLSPAESQQPGDRVAGSKWDLERKKLLEYTQTVKDWGVIVAGTFKGALDEGLSYQEAFDKIGANLTDLIPLYDALKAQGVQFNDELFESLINEQKLVEKFPELVAAAGSFDELFRSMQNLRGLTAETFASTENQMIDLVKRMEGAGFSHEAVLRRIAPALDEIVRLQKEGKVTVSDTTAQLILEAGAADLLGKSSKSAADTMKDGFDNVVIGLAAVIEALGKKVPDALQEIVNKANDARKATENIGGAAEGLLDEFGNARKAGRDAMNDIVGAANEAKDAIDRLNYGESPGGINSIPVELAKAVVAAADFERKSLGSFGRVKSVLDGMKGFSISNKVDPIKLGTVRTEGAAQQPFSVSTLTTKPVEDARLTDAISQVLKFKEAENLTPEMLNSLQSSLQEITANADDLAKTRTDAEIGAIRQQVEAIINLNKMFSGVVDTFKGIGGAIRGVPGPSDVPVLKYIPPPVTKDDALTRPWEPAVVNQVPQVAPRPAIHINVPVGAVQQNIDTWSLGSERDLIKNQIGPSLLQTIGEGGDLHSALMSLVTQIIADKASGTK